eukprot:Sdes_comp16158_c0_seq1m5402
MLSNRIMDKKNHIISSQPTADQVATIGTHSGEPATNETPSYHTQETSHIELKESTSVCATVLGLICCPLTLLCSWYTIAEREEAIILQFGKYHRQVKKPGIHFTNFFGRDIRTITTKKITVDLPLVKVADYNGNPLLVSAVVCYQYINPMKALLEVENHHQFVRQQAQTVMRQVVAQFPYESSDGSPSLKSEFSHVGEVMCHELSRLVLRAGAEVFSFRLDEISYAPEIAAVMLKKQQAKSIVEARHIIVEGSVSIARDALDRLEATGLKFTDSEKVHLVTNLLTVTCSENDAQPTIPLTSGH